MSRSRPTNDAVNPAQRFFEWEGSTGRVKYYDKEAKENKYVDLPFVFLVLDRLSTITGYSERDKTGYWANEVRNTQTDPLTIRTKAGVAYHDLYDSELMPKGARFTSSVYIAVKDAQDNFYLANIKFAGASIGAWIDFTKKVDVMKAGVAVAIVSTKDGKKGTVEFKIPVFHKIEPSAEAEAAAMELDTELQTYLDSYFAKTPQAGQTPQRVQDEAESDQDESGTNDADQETQPIQETAPAAPVQPATPAAPAQPEGTIDLTKIKF